jgi:hypothetical protein
VLVHAFARFDSGAGRQDIPLERRFISCFRLWLRQHLRREQRRRGGRPFRLAPPAELERIAGAAEEDGADGMLRRWRRLLYRLAVERLDGRTRTVLESRLRGEKPGSIARRLGLSPKTLANRYSRSRIAEAVRGAVAEMVRGLYPRDRRRLVAHLVRDVGLADGQVAKLLCLPRPAIEEELEAVRRGDVTAPEFDEAASLLGGVPAMARAA